MKTFNDIIEQVEKNPTFKLSSLEWFLDILKEEHMNSRNDWMYNEVMDCKKNLIKNLNMTDELTDEMKRVAWVFEEIGYEFLSNRQQDSYKDILYILLTK